VSDERSRALEHTGGVIVGPGIDRDQPRPLLAVLEANPGQSDELRALIIKLTRANRQESGCLAFIPYEADQFPGRFYLYEVFANAGAFEEHLETDHVKEFRTALSSVSPSGTDALVQLVEIPIP
jgi:quinol monooxygenase YgiN